MDTSWGAVYASQYNRLVAVLTTLAGSRQDAEEAVQEAFVRALGLTGHRAVVEDPEGWLYRVAVNVLRSRWRRVLAGRRASARMVDRPTEAPGVHELSDARMALLAALRQLPFAQREALALHYLADLPIDAIADRIGAPVGTVKARLSRGRDALARLLADESVKGGQRHV